MKHGIRNTLVAAASSLGLAGVLALGAAAPAQAFPAFTYYADCPGTARFQQLVIRNYSGASFGVDKRTPLDAQWIHLGAVNSSGITYVQIQYSDKVSYYFQGVGSLNWYYHVDCFY